MSHHNSKRISSRDPTGFGREEVPKKITPRNKRVIDSDEQDAYSQISSSSETKDIECPISSSHKMSILSAFDCCHEPNHIPFRSHQSSRITTFLSDCLIPGKLKHRCLLLTGQPGAGKTLLSHHLLHQHPSFITISLNANSTPNFPSQLSMYLLGAKHPLPQLIKLYAASKEEKKNIVFLVDEFDMVFKESEEILEIFKLFASPIGNLALIGTSNSMEMMGLLGKRYGVTLPEFENVVFRPYNSEEIRGIIRERIEEVNKKCQFTIQYEQQALRYVAAKISTTRGGDIRQVFSQMTNILSLSFADATSPFSCLITFSHATKVFALSKLNNSGTRVIPSLLFDHRIVLVAMYLIEMREEFLEVPVKELEKEVREIYRVLHVERGGRGKMEDAVEYLEGYQLVKTKVKRGAVDKVWLRVEKRAVREAFEDDSLMGRFFVE